MGVTAAPDGCAERSATLRLFLALWPDAASLQAVLAWRAGWRWPPGARLHPPERLHLTLHFIGQVAAERLPELRAGLAVPAPDFELRMGRAEIWPGGVALLCPLETPDGLRQLHERLADALEVLGLAPAARPYLPHVTLARKACGATPPDAALDLRWPVRAYVLAQSLQGYHLLQHYPAASQ